MKESFHKIADFFRIEPNFNNGLVGSNLVKLNYQDIISVITFNTKNVTKVTNESMVGCDSRTLEDFDEQYKHFIRIHKSYFVNIDKVNKRTNWSCVFISKYKFKVGRSYQKTLEKAINQIL